VEVLLKKRKLLNCAYIIYEEKKMSDFKDRCGGCEHTTGFELPFRGEETITQCALGYKVPISEGCSEFTPDITANCNRCFFYTKKESDGRYRPHCKYLT